MKKLSGLLVGAAMISNAMAGGLATDARAETGAGQVLRSGIERANIDPSVRPGNDLFGYVNGTWLKATKVPDNKASYGAAEIVADRVQDDMKAIFEQAAAAARTTQNSDQQKIGDLYSSYLDLPGRAARGLTPLREEFARIDAIAARSAIAGRLGYAIRAGYAAPFRLEVRADPAAPSQYAIFMWQSGLGLPDRVYYLQQDAEAQGLRKQYRDYVAQMFAKAGAADPARAADAVLAVETRLAEGQWSKEDSRDISKIINRLDDAELSALTPGFDWRAYERGAAIGRQAHLVVIQPSYLTALAKALNDVSLDDWKAYLKWCVLNSTADRLTEDLDRGKFAFYGAVLQGTQEPPPLWRRAVAAVSDSTGELAGRFYVERRFPPQAKARMQEIVRRLLKAYDQSFDDLDWMTPQTRLRAREKLSKMTVKIGYPDRWRSYAALTIRPDDLFGNLKRAAQFNHDVLVGKLGRPVDKTAWEVPPQIVDAEYDPLTNAIVFPAGILQPPFYDGAADDAAIYGGVGAVIGHEIGHAFDDEGNHFDGDGAVAEWWTDKDRAEFEKRTQALVRQYDGFTIADGLHVNGGFTLGENIGDLGGVGIAYRAYRASLDGRPAPVIDGLTGDQRFFMGWAQVFMTKIRPEAERQEAATDPHAPARFRVNGVVRNIPGFYEAFGVKPGDALYLAPEQRVRIW